jgi:prevent-host-death family protein
MDREVAQRELRNDSERIMREVEQGANVVVTRAGAPVARLSPLRRLQYVSAEAAVDAFRSAPSIDGAASRRDLDAVASQDATPRG